MKRSKKSFAFLSILLALAMVFTTLPAKAAESSALKAAEEKMNDAKAETAVAHDAFDAAVDKLAKAQAAVINAPEMTRISTLSCRSASRRSLSISPITRIKGLSGRQRYAPR